jgi:acid phosphatase type 7
VVAVGDIACDPLDGDFNSGQGTDEECRHAAVADVVASLDPDGLLVLGDVQYETGEYADFLESYDPSWGRFLPITYPAPGNHDYGTAGAAGYYTYFGDRAGPEGQGWYSFDLGKWHVVALNSNCGEVGGCGMGSPQLEWLAVDLAASERRCTLAYWHHPRFSSGFHGDDLAMKPLWRQLYRSGADVVLAGHDHDYERFRPMTAGGVRDLQAGIRGFVVGTGGRSLRPFVAMRPESVVADHTSFGLLEITLRPRGYDWRFVPAAGGTFTDGGSAPCHA